MQQSPFQFGRIANSQNFVNRNDEKSKLKSNFEQGVNSILISPRRWGKTSLVYEAARLVQEENTEIVFCFLDLMKVNSEEEFLQYWIRELVKASSSKIDDWLNSGKDFFKQLLPVFSVGVDPTSNFSVSLDWSQALKHKDEILDLPQTIALKRGKRIVVCIDEFQRIREFKEGEALESSLRSFWQHHQQVSYCLYGSQRQLMRQIFLSQKKPFYRFGDILFLEKISKDHWAAFIKKSFDNQSIAIELAVAENIAERMQCHPFYVQQLAHLVWTKAQNRVTLETVDLALEELIQYNENGYYSWLSSLSVTQSNLLKAISAGEKSLTASRVMRDYNLGTPNNVRKNKQALENKDMVNLLKDRIEFLDPGFEIWFRRISGLS